MDFNPLSTLLVQVVLSTFVVAFTSPTSLIRLAVLPLMATCTGLIIHNSMKYLIRAPWAALVGGFSISFFLQYLDVALLSRYSFEQSGLSKDGKVTTFQSGTVTIQTLSRRIKYAISLLVNFRFINTPQCIKNLPRFSNQNPDYVPSRKKFLLNAAATATISYLVLDLVTSSSDPEITAKYLSMANIPFFTRISEISGTEINIRVSAIVCLGISMNCVQGGIYCIMGFCAVICGISEPKSWPPFYGPVLTASSLRKFWAVYWHQINTRKLISLSKFILSDIYNLDMRNSVVRYLRLIMIFIFSGLMHLLIDIASGIPLQDSGALKFFLVQILGIITEDTLGRIYVALRGPSYKYGLFERFIGYVWVLSFLSWSVPAYLYPILIRAGPEHSTVPFSVVNRLMYGSW